MHNSVGITVMNTACSSPASIIWKHLFPSPVDRLNKDMIVNSWAGKGRQNFWVGEWTDSGWSDTPGLRER